MQTLDANRQRALEGENPWELELSGARRTCATAPGDDAA
jgi:hypothetical protein